MTTFLTRLLPLLAPLAMLAAPGLAQTQSWGAAPSQAQPDGESSDPRDDFLAANILGIFYHEFGHAVIDLMELPMFAQEEDAADALSALMIDWLFEEEWAQSIAYDSAFGYLVSDEGEEPAWWDVHGPDEQRFYNHVCLIYGANPDQRDDLAEDLGLPEERAEYCPDEYDMANASWGSVFDAMADLTSGPPMVFVPGGDGFVNRVLAEEVAHINALARLPEQVTVSVAPCGEANAYYYSDDRLITFCEEFAPFLLNLYDRMTAN